MGGGKRNGRGVAPPSGRARRGPGGRGAAASGLVSEEPRAPGGGPLPASGGAAKRPCPVAVRSLVARQRNRARSSTLGGGGRPPPLGGSRLSGATYKCFGFAHLLGVLRRFLFWRAAPGGDFWERLGQACADVSRNRAPKVGRKVGLQNLFLQSRFQRRFPDSKSRFSVAQSRFRRPQSRF